MSYCLQLPKEAELCNKWDVSAETRYVLITVMQEYALLLLLIIMRDFSEIRLKR